MPNNMLTSSLRSQCRTVGKLKCSEQLQPGNSKRPNIQLGQEHLPHFHKMATIPPINKPMGIMQINDQTNVSPNQVIGIPSKPQMCYSDFPTVAKNSYVFKRRSALLTANNQLHASNCSIGNMQPGNLSVESHNQLSSGSFVNLGPAAAVGSHFAITEPNDLVVENINSTPSIPTVISPSNEPQYHNADTPTKHYVILPNNSIICSDVIASQESKDSSSDTYKLMPEPSAVNPVSSRSDSNKLYLSYQCSNNPSTNHSINELDHTGPLINKGRASYTFKKMPVSHSYSQSSVLQLAGVQTNNFPAVDNKTPKNGTLLISRSASVAQIPHQNCITDAKKESLQVSTSSSSIPGCYVALGLPGISNTIGTTSTIIKDNPVHFECQEYATTASATPLLLNQEYATTASATPLLLNQEYTTTASATPLLLNQEYATTASATSLLLNLLSTEGGIENGDVESSVQRFPGCKNTSPGPTMNASNDGNVAELVAMSEEKNDFASDVFEPAVRQQVTRPKVPKKSAAPRKRKNKSSKSFNEATVTPNQESAMDRTSSVSADAVNSSEAVEEDTISSATTKKGATRKRAPKKASATKDSKTSNVAAKKSTTTATKSSDFSSEAPEVELDPLLVYFDLETTGLGYNHEITQISCVCPDVSNGGEFDVYTLPKGRFQPMASVITGLTKRGRSLYLHGQAVPTISLQEGLSRLLQWLEALPRPPLLVGHNSKRFDCPRLVLALWNNNLLDRLNKNICGFSDSLPTLRTLLPSRGDYKLENLLHDYCPDSTESSHNALDDCRALHNVLQEVVRGSTKLNNTAGAHTGPASTARASTQTAGTAMAVPGTPAAGAVCTTDASGAAKINEKLNGGDGVNSFKTMVSDFEQDLIREGLNECLLKEYFSLQTVLESIRRSAPARSAMKTGGS